MFKKGIHHSVALIFFQLGFYIVMIFGGWHLHAYFTEPSYCEQAEDITIQATKDAQRWIQTKSNKAKSGATKLYNKTRSSFKATWNRYTPEKMHIQEPLAKVKRKPKPQSCWKQYFGIKCSLEQK